MNKVYQLIRSKATGECIVVSELAHSRGKSTVIRKASLLVSYGTTLALTFLTMPYAAWAACTPAPITGGTTTCTPDTVQTTVVGTGPGLNNVTLIIDPLAQISTGQANAVSLDSNANITVGAGAVVENSSTSNGSAGFWASGQNTIEFNSNSTLTIQAGARVSSLGAGGQNEAVQALGFGNTIINNGLIEGISSSAIWIENRNLGAANNLENYGTIRTSSSTGVAIGVNIPSTGSLLFTNHAGGTVIGNISMAGGNDSVTLEAGSVLNGNANGGSGTNSFTLVGTAGSNDTMAGNISNFQTLLKQGDGQWTVSGIISDAATAASVTVNQGTLALTGANTYTGGTTVTGGILSVSADTNLGGAAGSVTLNGGTLEATANFTTGRTITINNSSSSVQTDTGVSLTATGAIGGSSGLTKSGAGTLLLTGAKNYTGGTRINAGTLQLGDGTNAGSISGDITNAGTLAFNNPGSTTFSDIINGNGTVLQLGGTTVLSGINNYHGGTTISAGGTVVVSTDANLGAADSAVNLDGGTLNTTATISTPATRTITLSGNNGTIQNDAGLILNGAISGSGTLIKAGTANLALVNTANTYTGGTQINQGTLTLRGTTTILGDVTNNGALRFENTVPLTFNGVISGTGSVYKAVNNTLLTLTGINNYTGNTYLSQGTLSVSQATNLGATSGTLNFDGPGGTLQATGSFDLQRQVILSGGNGTIETTPGVTLTASGVIRETTGSYGLNKSGTGMLMLGAVNTYTGATLINAGTLQAGVADAFASSSAVTVASGATLALNNFNQVARNFSGAGNVTLGSANLTVDDNVDTTFSGGINGSGSLTKTGAGTRFTLSGSGSSVGSATASTGTLSFAQTGAFTTLDGYTTATGATTQIAADATLSVGSAFTQAAGSTLNVALGSTQPVISAATASLDGTLNITGFGTSAPSSASALAGTTFNVIRTAAAGGITGDFTTVNLGGAASPVDYLQLASGVSADARDYNVAFGLTWLAGTANGNGVFTLDAGNTFNADLALDDQTGPFASGWDGTTLTKAGAGTLILSAANSYTGPTIISSGTLRTGIADTFASSSTVNVASGATLDLNSFNQTANNLSGAGNVTLGNAALTVDNTIDALFSGAISGAGRLIKTGAGVLSLTGANTYTGGTTILSGGTLSVAADNNLGATSTPLPGSVTLDGGTLNTTASFTPPNSRAFSITGNNGTFQLNDGTTLVINGSVSGAGRLIKTGAGTLQLNSNKGYSGGTTIADGVLSINSGLSLGAATSDVTLSGGTLQLTAPISLTRDVNITAATGTIQTSDTANNSSNIQGVISGSGRLVKTGVAALFLYDANTYTGGTTIASGNLFLSGANASILGDVIDNGTLVFSNTALPSFDGTISGTGNVTLQTASLALTATNSYTGNTSVSGGVLSVGADTNLGAAGGGYVAIGTNGTLRATNSFTTPRQMILVSTSTILTDPGVTLTASGAIIGASGALNKTGSGTLLLTGASTYSGATTISDGTLQIGNGGATGSIAGNIVNNATLAFDRTGSLNLAGAISGSGAINQIGAGTTVLAGNSNAFSGTTTVSNGTLRVNGVLGNAGSNVAVSSGGSLGGSGTLGGNVAITDGILAPGNSPGTLTINGDLSLTAASLLNYEFGQPGIVGGALNDNTTVAGNLTLDGTLNVTTSSGGSFGPGLYRVISYGGTLTNNGLDLGTQPAGSSNLVQTSVAGQVNLINRAGLNLNFWDGDTGPRNNNVITGGNGVWQAPAGNDNWSDSAGAINAPYLDGAFSIFSSVPGTVTVDDSLGAVISGGMQFAVNGYVLQGQPITLAAGSNLLRVGDGTASGAGYTATINSVLTGTGGIDKTDQGTLVLTGTNDYSGGTLVSGGTLQLGNGGTTGTITGNVTNNATLAFNHSDALSFAGVVSGSGVLAQIGTGTLTLTGTNTYSGGTRVTDGVLQVAANNNLGAATGALTLDSGTLRYTAGFGNTRAITLGAGGGGIDTNGNNAQLDGAIGGTGRLTKLGVGTLILAGTNTYTGGTTLSAGTLQIGNGGTSGSLVGDIANDAALVFDRSDDSLYSGTFSGSGSLSKQGDGMLTLDGTGSTQASVNVQQGTLQFLQTGPFTTTGDYTTQDGATTNIGQLNSTLRIGGTFTQADNATLDITLGASPDIVAQNAVLGGTLIINGFSQDPAPVKASDVVFGQVYTMLRTTGGITGDFVNNPLQPSPLDYLLQEGFVSADDLEYKLGFRLAWTQGGLAEGTGTFTVAGNTAFDVDVVLDNQGVAFASGWDGQSLIKEGDGLLVLSAVNTYPGTTTINAGTLQTDIANTFASSSAISIASGATLDLNGFDQIANNLSGAGNVVLGSATLTAHNTTDTAFDGTISGSGGLAKTGAAVLTLTSDNDYSGGTTINAGTLRLGDGGSTGSIVGDIVNNAALIVDRANAFNLDGIISGSGALVQAGTGTTTLAADNTYSGGTTISAGTLRLGDGGTTGGIVGDIVNNAALIVDRANAFNLDGIISGSGSLTQAGTGITTLEAASTYTGATQVAAGTLRAGIANAFSSGSAYQVDGGATLDTGGFNQTVAALDNTGTVNLLSAAPGSTLTVTGAYVGHGGILRLGTTLGDSDSASDRLVLDGPAASASGTTVLRIANVNGLGALTTGDGIEVISARNGATTTAQTTKDAFALGGGLATAGIANGPTALAAPHIDVGAYEYRLYAGDANGTGENWYLRSTDDSPTDPTYRIETPLLAALPAQMRQSDLAMLGNLQRRMGDTGAAQSDSDPLDRHAWARAIYTDIDLRQDGTVTPRSNGYLSGMQAGIDLLWSSSGWRTGVYGGYLQGNADVSGNARGVIGAVGRNDLRARYVGGYATWVDAQDGRYIDMVLQYGSHHYRVRPDLNANVSGDTSSLTASIELGQPLALTAQWSLEPQAQLVYQKGDIDELRLSGALVRQDSEGGWIGRLGIRIKGDLATSAGRFQPYARANLYLASAGADVARFIAPAATTDIATRNGYTSGELAAGMTLSLNRNVSLYAEAGHMFDLSGGARVRSSIQANAGVRIGWK